MVWAARIRICRVSSRSGRTAGCRPLNTASSTVEGMIPNIRNEYFGRDEQRRELDLVQQLNASTNEAAFVQ